VVFRVRTIFGPLYWIIVRVMNKWFAYTLVVQCLLLICEQTASRILDTVKYYESCVSIGRCYCALTINDVILQPLALGQGLQSATFDRSRHSHPSGPTYWELRHITTTCRPVNPLHIETWQINISRGHRTHQLRHQLTMDSSGRQQLVRQRAVAKSRLTRTKTFIETGGRKLNYIQVRFEELPNIFNEFKAAQSE